MTANIITSLRIILSSILIVLPPMSVPFWIIYLLCGISDMADGFIARITHTESTKGEKLDSIADFIFFTVCAVRLLPLMRLRVWLWIIVAVIAALKIFNMIFGFIRFHRLTLPHTVGNKITGLLLFLMPLTLNIINCNLSALAVCIAALFTAVHEIYLNKSCSS